MGLTPLEALVRVSTDRRRRGAERSSPTSTGTRVGTSRTRPTAASRPDWLTSTLLAPGPLAPFRFPPTYDEFGEARYRQTSRYVVEDNQLIGPGKVPGPAVAWRERRGVSNVFWDSLNNRSDPALLLMQARFLELTEGRVPPSTASARAELTLALKKLLRTGLTSDELLFFPPADAAAVVARLARAVGVKLSDVKVSDPSSRAPLSLEAWATRAGQDVLSYRELVERRTPAAADEAEAFTKRVLAMSVWFDAHPHATLDDYRAHQERRERELDDPVNRAFWAAMQDMFDKADAADLAGPGLGGLGAVNRPARPTSRPATGSGSAPTRPAKPAKPAATPPMTSWEMLAHPRFGAFLHAKSTEGYRGSFQTFLRQRPAP